MNILKISSFSIFFLILMLNGCNHKDDQLDPSPKTELTPVKIDLEEVFQFYPTTNKINNRLGSAFIPGYEDLLYAFIVSREIDPSNGMREIERFYYTYEELVSTGILVLNLEPNTRHWLELTVRYMLTADETKKAQAEGLTVEAVEVWNTVYPKEPADTIVTIIGQYQEVPSFSFGKHHLSWMFGLSTDGMIPDSSDTTTFSLKNLYLPGPSLFTIETDNSVNTELDGE